MTCEMQSTVRSDRLPLRANTREIKHVMLEQGCLQNATLEVKSFVLATVYMYDDLEEDVPNR